MPPVQRSPLHRYLDTSPYPISRDTTRHGRRRPPHDVRSLCGFFLRNVRHARPSPPMRIMRRVVDLARGVRPRLRRLLLFRSRRFARPPLHGGRRRSARRSPVAVPTLRILSYRARQASRRAGVAGPSLACSREHAVSGPMRPVASLPGTTATRHAAPLFARSLDKEVAASMPLAAVRGIVPLGLRPPA